MLSEWLEYKDPLKRYVARYIDNPHTAEDILQDVYIRASLKFHQIKTQSSVKSWLYRITHNVIMDFYRSQKNYVDLSDDLAEESMTPEETNLRTIGQCLPPMLQYMPEKYRIPLALAEFDGLPQQEVANQLNLSLSATKSRIQRGRKLLKEQLINCCNIETGREGIIDFYPKRNCKDLPHCQTSPSAA